MKTTSVLSGIYYYVVVVVGAKELVAAGLMVAFYQVCLFD